MPGRGINRCGEEVISDQDVDVVEVLDEIQPYGCCARAFSNTVVSIG